MVNEKIAVPVQDAQQHIQRLPILRDMAMSFGWGRSGVVGVWRSPAIEFKHTLDLRQVASDRSLVTYGATSILAMAHVWGQRSAILNSNDLRVYVDGWIKSEIIDTGRLRVSVWLIIPGHRA
jgi:hypothetical protein